MKEAFEYVLSYEPNTQSLLTWGFWLIVCVLSAVIPQLRKKKR